MSAFLEQYVIYKNPSDQPDKFVVRRWEILADGSLKPDQECSVCDDLDSARGTIPEWFMPIPRNPKDDDPAIFEVWI